VRATPLAVLLALPAVAAAHQAPSRDANNRYLKVTLLPERARVSYTLLFGERPGAAERRAMDTDGDGALSAAEARAFGERALAAYAPRVVVAGRPADGWRLVDVGLGTPSVGGGTFAVDLILDAPYPDPRAAEQELRIDDAAAVPLADEVELRLAESPGVRVVAAHLASERAGVELFYAFTGNARAPGERQVVARIVVDEALRPRGRPVWPLFAGALLALAGGAVAAWRRYRPV
jgi:hypothetical protein